MDNRTESRKEGRNIERRTDTLKYGEREKKYRWMDKRTDRQAYRQWEGRQTNT